MSLDPELDALPRRRRLRWTPKRMASLALIATGVVTGAIYGHAWWRHLQAHVSTDDAYITGRIAPVSARVSGHVAKVLVNDNQDVQTGDLLVSLDARDFEVALAEARAAAEAARADLRNATLNVPLTDDTTRSAATQAAAALAAVEQGAEMSRHDLEQRRSDLRAKQAAVAGADAGVRAATADLERARQDRDRLVDLFRGQLVARQDLDHAESAFQSAGRYSTGPAIGSGRRTARRSRRRPPWRASRPPWSRPRGASTSPARRCPARSASASRSACARRRSTPPAAGWTRPSPTCPRPS